MKEVEVTTRTDVEVRDASTASALAEKLLGFTNEWMDLTELDKALLAIQERYASKGHDPMALFGPGLPTTREMAAARVEAWADGIESVTTFGQFRMSTWCDAIGTDEEVRKALTEDTDPEGFCGTAACAAGWSPVIFPRALSWTATYNDVQNGKRGFNDGAAWFGIRENGDDAQWQRIVYGGGNRAQVARRMRTIAREIRKGHHGMEGVE